MTIGMISGLRRKARCAQRPTSRPIICSSWWASPMPSAAGARQRLLDDLHGGVEGVRLVLEAADQEVGRVGELAGVGVDDRQHGDDALLGQRAAVLEGGLGDAADGLARRRRRCPRGPCR